MGYTNGDGSGEGLGEGLGSQLGTPGSSTGDFEFTQHYGGGETVSDGDGISYESMPQQGCGICWDN